MSQKSGSATPQIVILLSLICLAGAFIRFALLGDQSFWYDEMVTGVFARFNSVGAVLDKALHSDLHPPLFYLLIAGWEKLFGESEVALRAFSALIGALMAPVALWLLRRHLSTAGMVVLALLFVLSPMLLEISQMARTYTLLTLVTAAASAFLLDLGIASQWSPAARRRLAWLTLVLLIGCWLHYFMINVAIAVGLVLLWRWRKEPAALRDIVIAGGLGALAMLPWIIPHIIARPYNLGAEGTWIAANPQRPLELLAIRVLGQPWSDGRITLAALACALTLVPWRKIAAPDSTRLVSLVGLFLAILAIALLGAFFAPSLTQRTIAVPVPPILIAFAVLAPYGLKVATRWRRYVFMLALAIIIAMSSMSGLRLLSKQKHPEWRESARLVLSGPACRNAEIKSWSMGSPIAYYVERYAPNSNLTLIDLSKLPPEARLAPTATPDCPVLFWGHSTRPGVRDALVNLIANAENPHVVKFWKVVVVIDGDAELPREWRDR